VEVEGAAEEAGDVDLGEAGGVGDLGLGHAVDEAELDAAALAVAGEGVQQAGEGGAGFAEGVADVADHPLLDGTLDQEVLLQAGSRSCTALPVATRDQVVGVLWAHYLDPRREVPADLGPVVDQLERHLRHIAGPEAEPGSPVAAYVVEAAQLRQALDSRNLIGMAKGILMARSGVTDEEAFSMLVQASQRENVKLREISSRIVASHHARRRDVPIDVPAPVPPPPPSQPSAFQPSASSNGPESPAQWASDLPLAAQQGEGDDVVELR
jgi:hypothetical protein